MHIRIATVLLVLAVAAAVPSVSGRAAAQQQDFSAVEIGVQPLAPGISMLTGAGGNIGLSVGDDGAFIVDDQYAPLTDRISAAVAKLTPRPVRFVINTHWHGDHTGGNENFGKAGAVIVAHDNVRRRMSAQQVNEFFKMTTPPSPAIALPVVTFAESVTLHLNGDEVRIVHVPPAHTDGDAVVHFTKANVVHMGDLYMNGLYPFIDPSSGGSVDGVVGAADKVLAMVNDQTKIIPGHGPLASRATLREFRDMLATVRDRIRAQVTAGKSLAEIQASAPTKDFDAKWGGGFLKPDQFVAIVHATLRK
jgi:glyoxylase-like metal-dependent hydrolase (beta-lactamase superfamily II)